MQTGSFELPVILPQLAYSRTAAEDETREGRVVEPTTPPPAAPPTVVLEVTLGETSRRHHLAVGEHVVGRGSEAEVLISTHDISRRHAVIAVRVDGSTTVRDLGSTNRTSVNGVVVVDEVPVAIGDKVCFGNVVAYLRASDAAEVR